MTSNLKQAIHKAMMALRDVDAILDGGEPEEIGELDDLDTEVLLDFSNLAGEVAIHAHAAADE